MSKYLLIMRGTDDPFRLKFAALHYAHAELPEQSLSQAANHG